MDKTQKQKRQNKARRTSILENLKDIGTSSAKSLKKDVDGATSQEFINQLFGRKDEKRRSGDISPG